IEERRSTLLRGRVLTRTNSPLSGVTVEILRHPELGRTLTRTDGMFDLVVNGGGELIVQYTRNGFFPVQRRLRTGWQEMSRIDDIIMVGLDPNVTQINMASPEIQVVQGSTESDNRGVRRGTLMGPPSNSATFTLENGSTISAPANLSLR